MPAIERIATAIVLAGLIAWPVVAPCQRISGRVSNALTGEALPGSQILLERAGVRVAAAVADSNGSFSVSVRVSPGSEVVLRVPRLGYRLFSRAVTIENATTEHFVDIRLERAAVELPHIAVSAQRTERRLRHAGFYERSAGGFGHFVTEERIRAKNPRLVTDALRGVPGVRITPSAGRSGSYEIYMVRAQGRLGSGRCPPKVFLDGLVTSVDLDDYLTSEDIAGIEIYRGPAETPAQFGGAESDCGVIVIWTK